MPAIGLIVTGKDAIHDFKIFVKTLNLWESNVNLYIYTDSLSETEILKIKNNNTNINFNIKQALNSYAGKNRIIMENITGKHYNSLWTDFMYEKANVVEWMLLENPTSGVWFLDADISFLASLPIIPTTATLALSPHYIRLGDCAKFGYYNGGFLWFKDSSLLAAWREHGITSTFYEQKSLENIAKLAGDKLYEFPPSVNFGWWRMYQGVKSIQEIQSEFSFNRSTTVNCSGIYYKGEPLQSVHTHWYPNNDMLTNMFNDWLKAYANKFKSHKLLGNYIRTIQSSNS